MQLNHELVSTPPRAAATVILLRDGSAGPQVFLLKRHDASDVLAGAYVFPGGKIDLEDSQPQALNLFAQQRNFVSLLGEPGLAANEAAGIVFAACRETFEECGVLLAAGVEGSMQRRALQQMRDGLAFTEVIASLGIRLDSDAIHAWSRWITPIVPSLQRKRFDTRFLIVRLPPDQDAIHDPRESSDGLWQTPRAAMDAFWAGSIDLAPPQIMTLAHLSRFASIDQVLHEASRRPPPVIQPEPLELDGVRVVAYPGDPAHPITARAMPGPTRLAYRAGRFEPFGGYEAFFG